MTIASCLVLPEGVIFGVDSTTSTFIDVGYHYLNHNQKLFEIGEESSMAIMTWGLSFFRNTSYRTLIARLADEFKNSQPKTIAEAIERWRDSVWNAYREAFKPELEELKEIVARQRASASAVSDERSVEDDNRYKEIDELRVGFCLGGNCSPDRVPGAYFFEIEPNL